MVKTCLYIKYTGNKGRGVFTTERLNAGIVVEDSPVIVMTNKDRELLDKTLLHDYIFEWGEKKESCCMALGYISIYNHSDDSNCEYFMDFENETIQIKASKIISAGEELTINYHGDGGVSGGLWFAVE